jgi:hypothetical protein
MVVIVVVCEEVVSVIVSADVVIGNCDVAVVYS